jgi:hypothetical protein
MRGPEGPERDPLERFSDADLAELSALGALAELEAWTAPEGSRQTRESVLTPVVSAERKLCCQWK